MVEGSSSEDQCGRQHDESSNCQMVSQPWCLAEDVLLPPYTANQPSGAKHKLSDGSQAKVVDVSLKRRRVKRRLLFNSSSADTDYVSHSSFLPVPSVTGPQSCKTKKKSKHRLPNQQNPDQFRTSASFSRFSAQKQDFSIQQCVGEDSQQQSISEVLRTTVGNIQTHEVKELHQQDPHQKKTNVPQFTDNLAHSSAKKLDRSTQQSATENSLQRCISKTTVRHIQPHKVKEINQQDPEKNITDLPQCSDLQSSAKKQCVAEGSQQENISEILHTTVAHKCCTIKLVLSRDAIPTTVSVLQPSGDCVKSPAQNSDLSAPQSSAENTTQRSCSSEVVQTSVHRINSRRIKLVLRHRGKQGAVNEVESSSASTKSSVQKRDFSCQQGVTENCRANVNSCSNVQQTLGCNKSRRIKVVLGRGFRKDSVKTLQSSTSKNNSIELNVSKHPQCEVGTVVKPSEVKGSDSLLEERQHGDSHVGKPEERLQSLTCLKELSRTKYNRWRQLPVLKNLSATTLTNAQIKKQLANTSDTVMDLKHVPASKLQLERLNLTLKWPEQPGRNFSGPLLQRFRQNLSICKDCEGNLYVPSITTDASKINLSRKNCFPTTSQSVSYTKCLIHNLPIECISLQDKCLHRIMFD